MQVYDTIIFMKGRKLKMIFGKGDSKTGTKPILKPEDAVQMKFAQRIQREVAREFIHFNVEINPTIKARILREVTWSRKKSY